MSDDHTYGEFLRQVELHTKRTFRHPADVDRLLQAAQKRSLEQVFADAVFHATFVVKTRAVMERIGKDAEGFEGLRAQFSEGLERTSTLLRTLLKEGSEREKEEFNGRFFSMDQGGLGRLMELLTDLSLVKHWQVDGRRLPFSVTVPAADRSPGKEAKTRDPLTNVIRSARLALVLLLAWMILDGPFTTIGWILAVAVAGLLLVVLIEGSAARKGSL